MTDIKLENFKIIRELGRGGMGIVYLAEDLRLRRRVALKFLKQEVANRERILREAQAASQLNHPGVVTIHDVLDVDEGACIVMEYVEGDSLNNYIKTHRISMEMALKLASQITSIVAVAHEHNIVHGDLKPANIIITPDGKPKLLDFGLSALLADETENNTLAGTFPFMAPEQIIGTGITPQTDIYSLGMIFYQLFTGHLPFDKEHQAAQIYAIINEVPEKPKQLNPRISDQLDSIILRCLEKQPGKRYASSKSLASNIQDLGAESEIPIPKRGQIGWYLSGLIVLLILFGLYGIFQVPSSQPIPIQSVEDVVLGQPVQLLISSEFEGERNVEIQARLLGLVEILREQLSRITGLQILLADEQQIAELTLPSESRKHRFKLNLLLKASNKIHSVEYETYSTTGKKTHAAVLEWRDFDDVVWISNQIISQLVDLISDRAYNISLTSDKLDKNIRAFRHFSHGLYQYQDKNYNQAIKQFDLALKIDPFFSRAHFYKGQSLVQMKQWQNATEEYYAALPEASQQSLIEWKGQLYNPTDAPLRFRVVQEQISEKNKETKFFLYYAMGGSVIKVIDIKSKESFPIQIGNSPGMYYCYRSYLYEDQIIIVLRFSQKKKLLLLSYNLNKKSVRFSPQFDGDLKISSIQLPWIYLLDLKNGKLIRLNVQNIEGIQSTPSPIKKPAVAELSKDKQWILFKSKDSLYLYNLNQQAFSRPDPVLSEIIQNQRSATFFYGYYVCSSRQENIVRIINPIHPEELIEIPLLSSRQYSLAYGIKKRKYMVQHKSGRILVLKPDTTLAVYQINASGEIQLTDQYNIADYPGNFRVIGLMNRIDSIEDLILYFPKKNNIAWFNNRYAREGIEYSIEGDKPLQIMISENSIGVLGEQYLWIIDRGTGEVQKFYGHFKLKYLIPEKKILLFYEQDKNRLVFFQYSTRKFLAYYKFNSAINPFAFYFERKIVFVEKNDLKILDLDVVFQQNPVHIANIYQKIAECYFQLGDYNQVRELTSKILDIYQPNKTKTLRLRIDSYIKSGQYISAALDLAKLHPLLGDEDPEKRQIVQSFFRNGLYQWEIPVELQEGFRYFEAAKDGDILFSDARLTRGSTLYKIDYRTGLKKWQKTVSTFFNGISVSPNTYLYSQSDSIQGINYYYLLDADNGEVIQKISRQKPTNTRPEFLPLDSDQILAVFRSRRPADYSIELVSLNTRTIRPFYHTSARLSLPKSFDNSVFFFAADTLVSFNFFTRKFVRQPIEEFARINRTVFEIYSLNANDIFAQVPLHTVIQIDRHSWKSHKIKALKIFPSKAYISLDGDLVLANSALKIKLGASRFKQIKDVTIDRGNTYLLEEDKLRKIDSDGKETVYPLLWPAIKFIVRDNQAFILSYSRKIYCVNLSWSADKLKNDLILAGG